LGAAFSGLSPSLSFLIAARIIQVLGAAFIAPLVLALVGEMVDPKHTGKAMGILGVMYTIGVTMGPLISGVLEVSTGWSWFFFFLMALALFVGALYWITSKGRGASATGSGRLSDALALVRQSLSYRDVRFLRLAAFSLFSGYIELMTFAADYLKVTFSLPSDRIGFVLSVTGFFGILVSPFAGILGDRWGRRPVAYGGAAIMIAAVLGLSMGEYTYGKYLFLFSLFGIGAASAWTCSNTLAVENVPHLRKPAASVYNSFKFSGYALSPLVLSLLYVPFSISAARWACLACILLTLILASQMGNRTH